MLGALPPAQVADWLRSADVFALPTSREGCCNALLEALACGLPAVTTPVGDNAVYVDPPRNGLLVPVADPAALAQAVSAALERTWDRPAIAAGMSARGWAGVARAVLDFFAERLQVPQQREAA
jgi:glycosyltransferase involved in cell wall biosynthesis